MRSSYKITDQLIFLAKLSVVNPLENRALEDVAYKALPSVPEAPTPFPSEP